MHARNNHTPTSWETQLKAMEGATPPPPIYSICDRLLLRYWRNHSRKRDTTKPERLCAIIKTSFEGVFSWHPATAVKPALLFKAATLMMISDLCGQHTKSVFRLSVCKRKIAVPLPRRTTSDVSLWSRGERRWFGGGGGVVLAARLLGSEVWCLSLTTSINVLIN